MLILVINLRTRPDRLAFMSAQLEALGLPFTRIDAVDAASARLAPPTPDMTTIERACALSHLKAWRHFLDTGHARCLILEDDVILSPALARFLTEPANFPDGIDALRLETRYMRTRLGPGGRCATRGFRIHRMHSTHYGAAAYVVTRSFAAAAARDLAEPTQPVDHVLFGPEEACFYPTVVHQLRPALCVQAELVDGAKDASFARSDLEPDRRERLYGIEAKRPRAAKPQRSLVQKCLREVGRWGRRVRRMTDNIQDRVVTGEAWRDVPFAGPGVAVAAATLHVPGSEQAVQS
jgi:glycosyl transferase, family 25